MTKEIEDCSHQIINFLEENEQYGDDWSEEIKFLKNTQDLIEEVRQLRKELEACPDCLGYGGLDATDCGGPYIRCESCNGSGTREE